MSLVRALVLLLACLTCVSAAEPPPAWPTVGMEGTLQIILPGTLLEARPVTQKSTLIVRIADTRPHGELNWYDLRFVGFVPGKYDLRDFLIRKDGSPTNNLPTLPVQILGLLPKEHNGAIIDEALRPMPFFGSYRRLLAAVALVWAAGWIGYYFARRKPKPVAVTAPPAAPPTFADRIRPFVEKAAAGTLDHEGQAQLERMLLNHWRDRLGLQAQSPPELMAALRRHEQAGNLLRQLEQWLHRPGGQKTLEVEALLRPYTIVPATPEKA
jgi:hypothetical protein